MTKTNDGGLAYPENVVLCPDTNRILPASEFGADGGMTLRQWYAGQALQGFCANPSYQECTDFFEAVAQDAFRMADAMIAHEGAEND